jgi:site-specific recombinase XerD
MHTMITTHSLELVMSALRGQNYSPKTLRAYGDELKQFLGWVRENRVDWDTPKRFSRVDIEGFMSYLACQQMTGVTRVRKLTACPEEVFHLLGRESHHLRQSREPCQRRETGGERAGDSP